MRDKKLRTALSNLAATARTVVDELDRQDEGPAHGMTQEPGVFGYALRPATREKVKPTFENSRDLALWWSDRYEKQVALTERWRLEHDKMVNSLRAMDEERGRLVADHAAKYDQAIQDIEMQRRGYVEEIKQLQDERMGQDAGTESLREGMDLLVVRNETLRRELGILRQEAATWISSRKGYQKNLDRALAGNRDLQGKVEQLLTDKHTLGTRIEKAVHDLGDVWTDHIPWASRDRLDRIVSQLKGEDL